MENPYQAPSTIPQEEVYAQTTERVIPQTPISLDAPWCIGRGWKLTCSNFGLFFTSITLPLILVWILNAILSTVAANIDGQTTIVFGNQIIVQNKFGFATFITTIISSIFNIFVSLGIIRATLDFLDEKAISFSTVFSQSSKLIKGVVAYIIFSIVVSIGFVLLIVPGIYLVSRYGFFLHAIVDKNCGIMESFNYSSELTKNNKMNVFVLFLLSILVSIAGVLALLVGLLWAYPTIFLAMTIAYCCLHHGKSQKLEQI
jgi:4-amino-4-deoxy-L-arabinose transferase-like glycosyltransferase